MSSHEIARQERLIGAHPRGRGFQILSRLARDTVPEHPEAEVEPDSRAATVLSFDQPEAAPRHRADAATAGAPSSDEVGRSAAS